MKTARYIAILMAWTAMMGMASRAYSQATATGHIGVTIVSPIAITKVQDMHFGEVSVESGAGSITLSPETGSRNASGEVVLMEGGQVSLAVFKVRGQVGSSFSITLPSSPIYLSNGSKQLEVTQFTSTPNQFGNLNEGTKEILIGATLQMTGDQVLGSYATTTPFSVTVNYN
jgi:hypothetical protein